MEETKKSELLNNENDNEKNIEEENEEVKEELTNENDQELSEEGKLRFRLHEIDLLLEEYEDKYYGQDIEIMSKEEVVSLKEEYKNIRKELKNYGKTNSTNTFWEKIPTWSFIYGILIVVIGVYPLVPLLPFYMLVGINKLFPNTPSYIGIIYFIIYLLYSLILLGVTALLTFKAKSTKEKIARRFMIVVLIIQALVLITSNLISIDTVISTFLG